MLPGRATAMRQARTEAALVAGRLLARPVPLQRGQERGARLQCAAWKAAALGLARRSCTAATSPGPAKPTCSTAAAPVAAACAAWRCRGGIRARVRRRQRRALLRDGRRLRCGAGPGSRRGPLAAARLVARVHGVRVGRAIGSWLRPRRRRGGAAVRERGRCKGVGIFGVQSCSCCACLRVWERWFPGRCKRC